MNSQRIFNFSALTGITKDKLQIIEFGIPF